MIASKKMHSYKCQIAWQGKDRIEYMTLYGSADSEEHMRSKLEEIFETKDFIIKITKQEYNK